MNLGLSIAFVVWLRWGVMGVLLSNLLTTLVGGGVLSGWLVRRIGFSYSYPAMRELRRFAVPYQLSAFGGFILTFGDRFFLQGLQGTDAVGIYSLGYKLGFLASTLGAGPFLSAWTPQRFEISHLPALERDRRYDQGFRVFNALLLPAGVALAVGARPLLRVMSDPAFFPAYTVVPLVALAYVLQGWTAVFRFGIDMSEKTLYQTYSVWASAVVIMVSYATLIPLWGILGAALATLIGFLVRTLLILYFAQRLWPVRFLWRRHLLALAAAVGLTAAFYRLVPPSAGFGPDLVASAIVVITMMAVALMTLIEADERQRTWEGFRQVVGSALARSWRGAR
jgi:O-antigen/teichoic acid export membrane protein